jgi:hypothetical protein
MQRLSASAALQASLSRSSAKAHFKACRFALQSFGGNRDQLLALAAPLATFRLLADARQVFQADESAGMGVQDLPGDGMVGAQLEAPVTSGP